MKNFVITIGREFGSGGHNLGQSLAKELGIPCYDRHLIEEAAVCGGFKMEELEEAEELEEELPLPPPQPARVVTPMTRARASANNL